MSSYRKRDSLEPKKNIKMFALKTQEYFSIDSGSYIISRTNNSWKKILSILSVFEIGDKPASEQGKRSSQLPFVNFYFEVDKLITNSHRRLYTLLNLWSFFVS